VRCEREVKRGTSRHRSSGGGGGGGGTGGANASASANATLTPALPPHPTPPAEADDLEEATRRQLATLPKDGIDLMFLGHGPEEGDNAHVAVSDPSSALRLLLPILCCPPFILTHPTRNSLSRAAQYVRAGSSAGIADVAGLCGVSAVTLEHHVDKFKAGGAVISAADEAECRERSHTIWTIGPATILRAKRAVQSVVDASTATAKKRTYRKVLEADMAVGDLPALQRQLQENPGLYARCHPNLVSLILPDVLG
jgi:hypothetical protein